jgi:hypothetical protein
VSPLRAWQGLHPTARAGPGLPPGAVGGRRGARDAQQPAGGGAPAFLTNTSARAHRSSRQITASKRRLVPGLRARRPTPKVDCYKALSVAQVRLPGARRQQVLAFRPRRSVPHSTSRPAMIARIGGELRVLRSVRVTGCSLRGRQRRVPSISMALDPDPGEEGALCQAPAAAGHGPHTHSAACRPWPKLRGCGPAAGGLAADGEVGSPLLRRPAPPMLPPPSPQHTHGRTALRCAPAAGWCARTASCCPRRPRSI